MKTIQHTFDGQELTLDFGKLWYQKFFGEATGVDPLNLGDIITNPAKQFEFIVGMVYAGVNCHNKASKQPLVSLETVTDWIGSMEDSEAAELINKFANAVAPKSGEENPQPASPSVGTN